MQNCIPCERPLMPLLYALSCFSQRKYAFYVNAPLNSTLVWKIIYWLNFYSHATFLCCLWTSRPWQVLCENEMKRKTKGKVNGEPFKLPVSGGSREGQDEEGNDGKVNGSQSSFRSAEEQGGTAQYSLSGISTLIGNCMGKEEGEGRVRAKGIGRNERCDLSFHQRFKGTKQDAQMENIRLLFLSLSISSLFLPHTQTYANLIYNDAWWAPSENNQLLFCLTVWSVNSILGNKFMSGRRTYMNKMS